MNVKIILSGEVWEIQKENGTPLPVRSFETYEEADKYCIKKGWSVVEIVED